MPQSGHPLPRTRSDPPPLVCPIGHRVTLSCYSSDSGRVLKVVFGTDDNGNIEPIIAEDIEVT